MPVKQEGTGSYHRGHGELHGLDGVSVLSLLVGESSIFGDELIQANHGHSVSTGYILHCLLSPRMSQPQSSADMHDTALRAHDRPRAK